MTELQLAIGHLNEAISVGKVLLDKMEAKQKDLEKPSSHKWEDEDIFRTSTGSIMVYIKHPSRVGIGSIRSANPKCINDVLQNAKFLYNLKETL